MSKHRKQRLLTVWVATLAVGTAACDKVPDDPMAPAAAELGVAEGPETGWEDQALDVYTQNVYLGGDTGPLFTADFTDVPGLIAAANVFWQQVVASAPRERMAAIVDEIDRRRPDVVGLQEVFQFGILDASFQPLGGEDLLADIEAEIAARGLPYQVAVVQPATSSALPLAFDPSIPGVSRWLSFTDREVILSRTDVSITGTDSGVYGHPVPLGPLELKRAWARVSIDHHGRTYNYVSTHLEGQSLPQVQAGQVQELLGIVATLDGITILGGDLNSDAAAAPGDASWTTTYDDLLGEGFEDVWTAAPHSPRDPGYTCCEDPDLRNAIATLDQRIDFLLVRPSTRPAAGDARGHFRADVVGDRASSRTESGLWPADHAGLMAGVWVGAGALVE